LLVLFPHDPGIGEKEKSALVLPKFFSSKLSAEIVSKKDLRRRKRNNNKNKYRHLGAKQTPDGIYLLFLYLSIHLSPCRFSREKE